MTEDERFAWLQLAFTPYIGAESFLLLMRSFGSAQNALSAPAEQVAPAVRHKHALEAWRNAEKRALARQAAEAALEWEMRDGCRLMLLQDEDFPEMLTQGLTAPPVLFLRGNVRLLHKPSAAIVGSRHATPQAMRIAKDFGRALGGKGIPTVSGMASGIDTAAHQGALEAEGGTIAVWGTG
ncbi:TPA: DNA-protecting protein DprA, partial [Neisseria gonorrhoeae]